MEPGTYIAIAQIAFEGACFAVKTFRKGLHFGQDAERLVLSLEVERFRLQIWGENAGLAPPDGQPPTLPTRLLPICDIIKDYLEQIQQVVKDADGLSSLYGLQRTEEPPTKSELVRRLVHRMQTSIRSSKRTNDADEGEDAGDDDANNDRIGAGDFKKTSTWKRVRWAILDVDKFDKLIKDLAARITKLNDLMTETQYRKTLEDNHRVSMVIVGSAIDEASLELIRAAVQGESSTSQIRTAVERKALVIAPAKTVTQTRLPLSLADFTLPSTFSSLERFIATKTSAPGQYYVLERKPYEPSLPTADIARLTSRIQRLVLLLSRPKSPSFRTPHAEGVIKDPANTCWWLVFRYPLILPSPSNPPQSTKTKPTPISLLTLLTPTSKFRPALEHRLTLAYTLVSTLSELFSSGWLHKSIRSDVILFPSTQSVQPPFTHPQMERILAGPLLCGFDYTRHESEWATIDKAKTSGDVHKAIYRHPDYQGDAAEGYQLRYDVYSIGLVLVEIALWMPLATFLEGKVKTASLEREGGTLKDVGLKEEKVELKGDMKSFWAPHARELRRRVVARVESELAFRVGSGYAGVVRWCLGFGEGKGTMGERGEGGMERVEEEVGVHLAMEFYNQVVVVLGGLVGS